MTHIGQRRSISRRAPHTRERRLDGGHLVAGKARGLNCVSVQSASETDPVQGGDSHAPQRLSFQVGTHCVSTFHMSNGRVELYSPGHLYISRPARRIKRGRTYADPKEGSPVYCHVHSEARGDTDCYQDILSRDRQSTIFPNDDGAARVYLKHS